MGGGPSGEKLRNVPPVEPVDDLSDLLWPGVVADEEEEEEEEDEEGAVR
jgi:hypothetical protein